MTAIPILNIGSHLHSVPSKVYDHLNHNLNSYLLASITCQTIKIFINI